MYYSTSNIWVQDVIETLKKHANEHHAPAMEAYMRNKFTFLGIKKPERIRALKPYFQKKQLPNTYDDLADCVYTLWDLPQREFQYVAMDILAKSRKLYTPESFALVTSCLVSKSWWDTVDLLASNELGYLVTAFPEYKAEMDLWITDSNLWKKRASIIYQLHYKQHTDIDFLQKAITLNMGSKEFFINKAIGWALRQYARTHSEWVLQFVAQNEKKLDPLSVREARKHLHGF